MTFLTATAALMMLAASCGQNANKQKAEEPQQEVEQATDGSTPNQTRAYVKFDGKTLLVDDFVWVSWDDTEAIKRYGLTEDDMDDDYHIVNEVVAYETWKLLPDATFSIIKYIEGAIEEGYASPTPVEVSRAEFTEYMKQWQEDDKESPPMRITGSRSGVSRIAEIYVP